MPHLRVASSDRPLTAQQSKILGYIRDFLREHNYPPTLREIGAYMKIKSTNGVNDHLRALERKGYIAKDGLKSRGLKILRHDPHDPASPPEVAAADQEATSGRRRLQLPVHERLTDDPVAMTELPSFASTADLVLVMRGVALERHGIFDGDWLFVDSTQPPAPGRIVLVSLGDDVVPRIWNAPQQGMVQLDAAHRDVVSTFLRVTDIERSIFGTAIAVFRKLAPALGVTPRTSSSRPPMQAVAAPAI